MSTSRRLLAASLAAVAAFSLSACDADQIGAAAVVDGQRITVGELQDTARELAENPDSGLDPFGDLSMLQRTLLSQWIRHDVIVRMAEDNDVDVSDADVDARIDEEYRSQAPDGDLAPLLAQNGYTEQSFRDSVYDELVAQEIIMSLDGDQAAFGDEFNATADEVGIEVNPRYGTWGQEFQIDSDPASLSGSISTPFEAAPEAASAPAPAP